MQNMFNAENYSASLSSFVSSAVSTDGKANAFVPLALAGLIEKAKSLDVIVTDLCGPDNGRAGATKFRSVKGKAVASALPQAVGKAYRDMAAVWKQCELDNALGAASLSTVKAFVGYLTDEQETLCNDAYRAYCEAKGISEGDATRASHRIRFLNSVYVDRPANFSQLRKAIDKLRSDAAKEENAIQADITNADNADNGEGEGEGETPADDKPVSTLAGVASYIASLSASEVAMASGELQAIMTAIGEAWQREAEAAPLANAA